MIFVEEKDKVRVGDPISKELAKKFYEYGYIDVVASGNGKSVVLPAWHREESQKEIKRVTNKDGSVSIKGNKYDLKDFNALVSDLEKELGKDITFTTKSPENNITRRNVISDDDSKERVTGVAYKLFLLKNGKLYPPKVKNPGNVDTPIGKWITCGVDEFVELSGTWGKPKARKTDLAYRPGWHLGELPYAPQFEGRGENKGYLSDEHFVWAECVYNATIDYNEKAYSYGYSKDGGFSNSAAGLPYPPDNGAYKYRTNPNPNTIAWVITGEMKVVRILSDAEVEEICRKNNVPYLRRKGGDKTLKELGLEESLKEDMGLSKEETLKLMDDKYGQDELYLWSTYILPNGHFLNQDNGWDEFDDDPDYEHSDFIYNYYNDYGETLFDDCIKMNVTVPYLIIPKQPTRQQWNRVEEIVDNYDNGLNNGAGMDYLFDWAEVDSEKEMSIMREFQRPLLIDLEGIGAKIVDASWGGREIVKELKKAKSSGGFYESLKEGVEMSNEYDSEGNQLTKAQADFFRGSKVRDTKGNLLVCYHSTDEDFDEFDDEYSYDFGFHFGTLNAAQDRGGFNIKKVYLNAKNVYTMEEDLQYFDAFGFTDYWMRNKQEALKFMSLDTFSKLEREWEAYIEDGGEDDQSWWCVEYNDIVKDILYNSQYDGIKYMNWAEDAGNYSYMVFYPNQIKNIRNKKPTNRDNMNEKLKEKLQSKVDSLGNELSDQQLEYFKKSKVVDRQGNLLVCYHGSSAKGLEIFDANGQIGYKFEGDYVNFFTNSEKVAKTYMYDKSDDGELYSCYLNIEHPYYVKNKVKKKSERTWSNIKDSKTREMRERLVGNFLDKWFGQDVTKDDIDKINKDLKYFGMSVVPSKDETNIAHRIFKREDENLYNVHRENRVIPELSCLPLDKLFGKNPIDNNGYYTDEDWTMALEGYTMQDEEGNWAGQTTNDVIRCILYGNDYEEFKNGNYDGIIIKSIKDSANGDLTIPNANLYITIKSPNQIKRIDNKNPTDSLKINESKNDIEKFTKWAGEDLANKFFKLKNRLQGEQKDIYYWMGLEKQFGKGGATQELSMVLRELEARPTKKERNQDAKEGSEKIYEDSNWLVLKINNYEASRKYGKGTTWCITGDKSDNDYDEAEGRRYWDNYSYSYIYFFIDKNNKYNKYALIMNDIDDWALWCAEDFVILGDGYLFEDSLDMDASWDISTLEGDVDKISKLPKINGLPDFEERCKYILDHRDEFEDEEEYEESLNEDVEDGDVWYRGYDSRYGVLNSGDTYSSLYTWLTDDFDYAIEYASENKYGKVAKIKLTCSEDDIGSLYDLPEDCDYLDIGDEDFQEYILDEGLYGYDFYANDDESYCLCVSKDVCKVIDKDVKFDVIDESKEDEEGIVAYCGSQESELALDEEPIYLVSDEDLARQYALGFAFDFDLLDDEMPTLYTMKIKIDNPLEIDNEDDFNSYMDEENIEDTKEFLIENGYDGIIYIDEDSEITHYMPLNAKEQCEIVDKEQVDANEREIDDAEVEAQRLSTYEAFMNLKGEDDE